MCVSGRLNVLAAWPQEKNPSYHLIGMLTLTASLDTVTKKYQSQPELSPGPSFRCRLEDEYDEDKRMTINMQKN
jgi:hypothetical protein